MTSLVIGDLPESMYRVVIADLALRSSIIDLPQGSCTLVTTDLP